VPILLRLCNGDTLYGEYEGIQKMPISDYIRIYDAYRENNQKRVNLPKIYDSLIIFVNEKDIYQCQLNGFESGKILVTTENLPISEISISQIDSLILMSNNYIMKLDTLELMLEERMFPKCSQISVFAGELTRSISVHDIDEIYLLKISENNLKQVYKEQMMIEGFAHDTIASESIKSIAEEKGFDAGFEEGIKVGLKRDQTSVFKENAKRGYCCCCFGGYALGLTTVMTGNKPYILPKGNVEYKKGYLAGYNQATKAQRIKAAIKGFALGFAGEVVLVGSIILIFVISGQEIDFGEGP